MAMGSDLVNKSPSLRTKYWHVDLFHDMAHMWPQADTGTHVIISPNEVFGYIMVLASTCPHVDPDDLKTSQRISF